MRKTVKWTLLSLVALLVAAFGYYGYSFYQFGSNIQKKENNSLFMKSKTIPLRNTKTHKPPKWEGKERVNILLLGGDSRGLRPNEIPRSDTIMVASIDPVTKKTSLFSLLRDFYVDIPGHGKDRINAAITMGGPELAMETVSNLLGIPVQYYIYTDFKGFIALVDAVDGIDIDVEKDMRYIDRADSPEYNINLKKGLQHMDGLTALQYVRFRHDALSDYSRTERQRKFMQALAVKLQSTSSILKLPKILSSVDPYIETNLTISEMLKLGALGFDVNARDMASQQLPPSQLLKETKVGGASVLTADKTKLREFVQKMLNDEEHNSQSQAPNSTGTNLPRQGKTAF